MASTVSRRGARVKSIVRDILTGHMPLRLEKINVEGYRLGALSGIK
jgi:hypothetical protein